MNNGLLYFGGLLVVVLSALFAVPNFVDWNGYRGVFEEEASKVLGRDVRVGGSVNLKLLPVPYVRFEKVRISNLTGQTGEPFVRAESFTMWLSGPALLRGVLEASQIELDKPVLTLAVDEKGSGNWTSIELKPGDLPFVPHDVALRSVRLREGAISIYNAASERVASLDGIDGELSADGLKGPFRFKGLVSWSGAAHDVKFATDIPDPDGTFALKVSARGDSSPIAYMLDGRVSDLSNKPTFKGNWTGKLAIPGSETIAPNGKAPPLLDLKADVTADALGAKFEKLALSLDDSAAPQMITGSAVATWTASPRLDLSLQSKWLDIDRLAGAGQGSASFAKLKQLAGGLMQSVAGDSTATAKINLEQVKVGGENAGGLSIDAVRQGNVTHLNTFKVSLPGGSRLDLAGELKNNAGKFSFAGNAFIGGSSFGRLKAWAEKSGVPIDFDADGSYSAAGKLEVDDTHFALTDASGDLSGRALAGELKILRGDRQLTDLTLQAADLDTREVFPKIAAALNSEFRRSLGLHKVEGAEDPRAVLPGDVRLRVIASRLTDGDVTYRDVDVSFAIEGRDVKLPVARLTTANGLSIELEGRVETRDGGPAGTFAFDLVGGTPDAMRDLVSKAGLSTVLGEDRFAGLKAGKIAGLIRLGLRSPTATDVTFDGMLNGANLTGAAEFDGGLGGWRSQPSRIRTSLDAPSLSSLLSTLGRSGVSNRTISADQAAQKSRASLVTAGVIGADAEARADITSPDFNMSFTGKTRWPENAKLALDGRLDFKAAQIADALVAAGISLPSGAEDVAARGSLQIGHDANAWTIATRDFSLGMSTLAAHLTVTPKAEAVEVDGNIDADRVAFQSLLAAVTDARPQQPTATAGSDVDNDAAADAQPIWPEGLFNFAALGNTNATLKIAFKTLDLSGGLATHDGKLTLILNPGKLAVSDLSAAAAGGQLSGTVGFEKASNGVAFASTLKLDQAKLSTISTAGKGTATIDLKAEARAQSPAGLVAVMTGTGTAKFADAEISGPSTATVAQIVDDILGGKLQNEQRAISAALANGLNSSKLAIGNREFAVSIADGSIKLDKFVLDGADGQLEGNVTADLAMLDMNAAFQLTSNVRPMPPPAIPLANWTPPAPKGPLPAVVVLYDGPLDNLGGLTIKADVASLQRELVVRQMERNVEELERSRRIDEERVRLEKERRKKLAAERAAALAAAKKKEAERLMPGGADATGPANEPSQVQPGGPSATPPVAPQSPATQNSPPASDPPAQAAEPQDAGKPQDAPGNTVLTPKISVEPLPPEGAVGGEPNAATGTVVIDPETGLPVPKPEPAVRPSTGRSTSAQKQPRRTSSDEVMKSLGGFQ
ncbi:AsmA family protein [Hyphomicrobium sp.]|uniref:AsmA family protein n=1 Tax=Hyphomicrobium sp. TaxID=82 RepID=UPI000F900692|nr:AsmA family protein [Hyphomicrobium sp.]RUP08699.1 MAG: AsmA family protein [Hyphomicrobium sp.]